RPDCSSGDRAVRRIRAQSVAPMLMGRDGRSASRSPSWATVRQPADRLRHTMDHAFRESRFSIGVEEELMIVDAETQDLVNAVEQLLEDAPVGTIKPELMESVLEIATDACKDVAEAGDQLRTLRRHTNAT